MKHQINLGVRRSWITPSCTCGRWTGTPASTTGGAQQQANAHLADVGQAPVNYGTPTWGDCYARRLQAHGGYGRPSGGSGA